MSITLQPWEMFVVGICFLLCAIFGTRGQLLGVLWSLIGCLSQSPPFVIIGLLVSYMFEREHPKRS